MTDPPNQLFGKVYNAKVDVTLQLNLHSLAIGNYRLEGGSNLRQEIETLAQRLLIDALGLYTREYPEPHKTEFELESLEVDVDNPVYVDSYETTRWNVGVQLGEEIQVKYMVSGKERTISYVRAHIDDAYRDVKTELMVALPQSGWFDPHVIETEARELYMAKIKSELDEDSMVNIVFDL